MDKIAGEKILRKTETSAVVEFSIPETSDYFDGHFPGFPILAAVAQVDIIMRYASDYFKIGVELSEIKRIKFTSLIKPDTRLVLNLEKKDNIISFKMNSPDGKIIYSAGVGRLSPFIGGAAENLISGF